MILSKSVLKPNMLFASQSTHLGYRLSRRMGENKHGVAITVSQLDVSFSCNKSVEALLRKHLKLFTKVNICSFSHILSTSVVSISVHKNRKWQFCHQLLSLVSIQNLFFFFRWQKRDVRQDVHAAFFHMITVNSGQASCDKKAPWKYQNNSSFN